MLPYPPLNSKNVHLSPKRVCTSSLTLETLFSCALIKFLLEDAFSWAEQMPRRGTHAYLPHTCNPWRDAGPEASKDCALLLFLLSLPGNYSPGCAFGCYRDPSSASPSSSWRIQQLLLLPLLFRLLSWLEAAGSCCPGTYAFPHTPAASLSLPFSGDPLSPHAVA